MKKVVVEVVEQGCTRLKKLKVVLKLWKKVEEVLKKSLKLWKSLEVVEVVAEGCRRLKNGGRMLKKVEEVWKEC